MAEMMNARESEIADIEDELELIANARIPQGTNAADPLNAFRSVPTVELDARERDLTQRLVALGAVAVN